MLAVGCVLLAFLCPNIGDLASWKLLFYIAAIFFVWDGLRPWGRGTSLNDLNSKLDGMSKKYR